MEPATVVIDNGTGYTKMGYAGNMEPSYLIPSIIATADNKTRSGLMNNQSFKNAELDFYIGEEAEKHQKTHNLRYLLRSGQIQDWEGIEKFWHRSIYSYLRCEPEEHRFILTEPPMNTPENREQMAEIMFETFGVKGLFIGVQATLALYAQICGPNQKGLDQDLSSMTGTVIDSGDGVTHVFPVCDGFVIGSCVKHIPLAGRDITKFTLQSLKDRGEKYPPEDSNEIAMKIKEKYGYVCKDVLKEYSKFDEKEKDQNGNLIQSSKFKTLSLKTINGNNVELDVGYERFLGPEMFFHPEFVHADWRKPLEEVVDEAIQSCPITYRVQLYKNIVLSGGSTLFKGFDNRLQSQLKKRVDNRMAVSNKMTGGNDSIDVEVAQNMVQRYAVWFGGSVLGASEGFPTVCKSRQEYEEYGPSICRHNPVFNM